MSTRAKGGVAKVIWVVSCVCYTISRVCLLELLFTRFRLELDLLLCWVFCDGTFKLELLLNCFFAGYSLITVAGVDL